MIDFHFFSKNWLIWHPQQKTLGLFPWCWPAISIRRLRKNHQIISKIYSVPRYPFTKRWKAPTPDFKGFYQNRLFQNTSLNHSLWEPVETPPGFFLRKKRRFVQLQPPLVVVGFRGIEHFPFLCQNVRLIRCHFVFRKRLMFFITPKTWKKSLQVGVTWILDQKGMKHTKQLHSDCFYSFLPYTKSCLIHFSPSCFW